MMMQKLLQRSSSYIKTLVKSDKKKLERKYKSNPDLTSAYYNYTQQQQTQQTQQTHKQQHIQQTMEYKSGILYKLSTGIFKNRKKFWFVLTRTHFLYYSSPDKLSNPIESILLTDIKNIILLQKEAESLASTYGFIIEYSSLNSSNSISKLILQTDSLSSIADWVIKLDGIIHPNFKSFLGQVERKQLLKILYKDNIKGGIIKSSDTEEWNYSSIGTLFIESNLTMSGGSNINGDGEQQEKIDYHWDGEWLKSSNHNSTLGYGRFNGVYLAWFIKDANYPEIRYFYDEKEKEYISDRKEFTFKWTRHFLASKYGSGEWIVEGHVPQPVVMFLQLIKYKRNSLKPGFITPFACDIPVKNNSSSNSNSIAIGSSSGGVASGSSSLPIQIEQSSSTNNINQSSSSSSSSSSPSSSSPGAAPASINLIITPLLSTSPNGGSSATTIITDSTNNNNKNNEKDDNKSISSSSSTSTTTTTTTLSNSNNNNNNNIKSSLDNNNNNNKSNIKIVPAPYTKGNAMINVSRGLFRSSDGYEEDIDQQKQQEISNFSSSSDDLTYSASIQSFTSHQRDISNVSDNLEVFNLLKNIKKLSTTEEEQEQQDQEQQEQVQQQQQDEIENNLITQFQSNQEEQQQINKINHQRKSTIQLLNDTIDESDKIKTRKSFADQNTLQQIINDFNNRNYNNDSPSTTPIKKQQQQQQQPQQQYTPIKENNIMNSPSNSTESLISSPTSKFTTPLGAIVGPNELQQQQQQQQQPTTIKSKQQQPQQPTNNNNNNIVSTQQQQQQQESTIGNHRKPLAKSKSSDKVTSIINQIAATKSSRSTFCIYCNLAITGPMIVAQGSHAHQECHKCFKCKVELGTKTFYRQQPDLHTSGANYYYSGGSIGSSSGLNFLNFSNSGNFVTLSSSPSSATGSPNKFSLINQSSSNNLMNSLNSANGGIGGNSSPLFSQSPPTTSGNSHSLSSQMLHNSNSNSSINTIASNHHKSGPRYLCQGCFDECSNICPRCNSIVQYRCKNYMGKKWHPDCCSLYESEKNSTFEII